MKRNLFRTCAFVGAVVAFVACSDNQTLAPKNRAPSAGALKNASTASNGEGQCMFQDAVSAGYKQNSLQCTANDVSIGEADVTHFCIANVPLDPQNPACTPTTVLNSGDRISCTPGQHIYAKVDALIQNSAQERFDMGLWILDPGLTGNANTGSQCTQYNLNPGSNGAVNLDGDSCGDVNSTTTTISVPLDVLDLTCPSNGQTTVSIQACAGWSNSQSGGNDVVCPIPGVTPSALAFREGTTPPEGSKCTCNTLPLQIDVKGVLRIKKVTDPSGSSQSFGFTTTGTDYTTPFSLTDQGTNSSGPLSAGTYTAAETPVGGWDLTGRTCVNTNDQSAHTFTNITNGVSVGLLSGDDVTCTFTNTKHPTLTIVKRIVNDNGGTAVVGDFGITTTAGSLTFGAGAADGTNTLKYTSNTLTGLTAGAFSLHEGTLTGYTEGTWSCTAGTVTNTTPASGSVTLANGQDAVCTITNDDQGASLILVKRIVNDNGGTAVVGDFGITTTAGSLTFGAGAADGANTLKYTSNTLNVNAGAYSLHEGTLTGYTEGTWSCTAGNVTNTTPASGSVTLAIGQSATCTITNDDQPASLTIVKRIANDNGGTAVVGDFGITTTAGSLTFGAGAADGANTLKYTSNTLTGLSAGSKTLHEGTLAGYTEGTWSCTAGNVTNTTPASGAVTLANGQSATCTITNDDQAASLTIVKRIVNDNGGTAVVGAFGITTTAGSLTFGAGAADGANTLKYTSNSLGVSAGAYSLHEGTLTGYTEGTWSCTAGNVTNTTPASGSVTLALGQSATCTITNDDQPASLTIVKRIVNDNGGTAVVGAFGITTTAGSLTFGAGAADGANTLKYTSNTLTGLSAGSKTLHEGTLTGYTEGTWSCDVGTVTNTTPASGAVTLANGQSATCTITNDDQPATLILVKVVKGAGATFTFDLTGSGLPATQDLTPATDNQASHTFSGLSAGLKSITELVTSGYVLTDLGCDDQPIGTYDPTVTQTVSTTLANGGTVTCTYTNEQHVSQTTRTQGFWATHRSLTTAVWFGGTVGGNTFNGVTDKTFCIPVTKDLSSIDRVLGGFWAGISQTTSNKKRSSVDQARMQLVQQLLAAILNNAAFGSSPSGGISIADAKTAYCRTDAGALDAIKAAAAAMAAFNTSGDNGVFTPGVSANGKDAKDNANLGYWDILP